jgi:hypothetical protein
LIRTELSYDTALPYFQTEKTLFLGDDYMYEMSAAAAAGRRLPGDEPKLNEDTISIVSEVHGGIVRSIGAAVFDGATSQKPTPGIEGSGARFASNVLKELYEGATCLQEPHIALRGLNRAMYRRFRALGVDYADLSVVPTAATTLLKLNARKGRFSSGHVCDTFGAVLLDSGRPHLYTVDQHRPHDQEILELILEVAAEEGLSFAEARKNERVQTALLEMFQRVRNSPDGCGEGVVNGDKHMKKYIHRTELPLVNVKAILGGTDGLVPPGMESLSEDALEAMFAFAEKGGVQSIIQETHRLQDSDPDREEYPRYKHADDASGFVLWRV